MVIIVARVVVVATTVGVVVVVMAVMVVVVVMMVELVHNVAGVEAALLHIPTTAAYPGNGRPQRRRVGGPVTKNA